MRLLILIGVYILGLVCYIALAKVLLMTPLMMEAHWLAKLGLCLALFTVVVGKVPE